MEKKIIDLEIIDELEDSGVDAIALVDNPAIEKNFMYFKKESFVEPKAGEDQSDYMGRCVPALIDEGKPQDQAVAICISTYENMGNAFVYDTFADYPWDECISDMADRGYDEESSNKLCGWIRANMEINTSGLAPYTQQTPKKKKDLVEKSVALASVEELAVGDAVSWKTADQNPRGRIKEIVYRSKVVPGTDFRIEGTQEDPGFIIEIYEKSEGKWQPTGKYVGRKADSILKNVELWRQRFEDDLTNEPINFNKVLEFARTAGFTADDFKHNGMEFNEIPDNFHLELAKGYTVYKYAGSIGSDSRDFCREMMGLDRFYTFEEIDAMGAQAVNPGFGLGGASTYSIWDYKGGPNCKHRWQKFYVTAEGTIQNKGKAPGTPGERPEDMANHGYAFESQNSYMFADESKKELVGPVAIPDIQIPRKDDDGNIYFVRFSKEVVKKMAEKFMREQRLSDNNIQHKDEVDAGSYVFESWVTETEDDKANSVYKLGVPVGTWMVKMRVTNPDTWKKVRAGELNGFSLQGNFVSSEEYETYMKDKKMYEDLVSLVKGL